MNVPPKDLARLGCITSCPNHRPTRTVQVLVAICVSVICTGLLCLPVRADVPMSDYILLYFEQDGNAYDKPVRFDITCYGYKWDPGPVPPTRETGSYQPEVVYRVLGDCPHYGCRISHSVYLNYAHSDYCDLVAKTEGQDFALPKFAPAPVDLSTCNGTECSLGVDLATSAILDGLVRPWSSNPPPYSGAYDWPFLIALLLLTLLIEVPILLAMIRYAFGLRTIGWLKPLSTGVLASALTLPCLWFFIVGPNSAPYALVVGEILVFLVEAGIYALVLKISIRRALLTSFVANLASLALGLVLF